ncbi:predicted protein [Naegleria gruberi]|uniref:Predicted protein n=1 Tax=Naegleria gruberi TaxID=5762 RepID=D2VNB6_NAEGR|nr:uncharacterized protein NAEGRDRAFT_60791 [Naegleria gruberi]EFC41626.1 predicted protein [Naegleria gruberi]|eukprot:XP_002674370.1 predicted protein [Naegleria gruberi strain NEG-M]
MNLVEEVELSISCNNLPNLDLLSLTDAQVHIFSSSTSSNQNNWVFVGKTEIIWDNLYPKFVTKFLLKYYFETNQYLKFIVVDIDNDSQKLEDQELVGEMYCTLGEIVGSKGGRLVKPLLLPNKPNANRGFIAIRYEKISASNLDSKNFFFGKSDPFLVINRVDIEANEYSPVYKSEYYKKTLECSWKPFQLTTQTLCNDDKIRGLRLEVYDWNKSGKHELIGHFDTNLEELLKEGKNKTYLLINPELKKKKKNYIGSGNIKIEHIDLIKIPPKPTFLDYIRGGHQISLMVAIDFTISNVEAWKEISLHYMKEGHENDYQRAIRTVGDILNYYDSDKKYPVYGFGGKLPNNKTSYCFAANLDENNPEVYGVNGILEAYKHAIENVQLSAPTNFKQIIRKAADLSEESKLTNYYILLILTDGGITDLQETIDEIVRATNLPLSIIIVGIGKDSFGNMDILDADEKPLVSSKGVKMVRDIVQFVPFRDFKNADPSVLAKEVLQEVPLQFLSYMATNNIMPQPPIKAESFYGSVNSNSNNSLIPTPTTNQ